MVLRPETIEVDLRGMAVRLVFIAKANDERRGDLDTGSLDARIHVESVPYTGRSVAQFQRSELESLRSCFVRLLSHNGHEVEETFALDSGELSIRIHLSDLGRITGAIEVNAYPSEGPLIRIPIHADQTYVPLWIKAIDTALEAV
jgi:hypothetical protein